MFLILRIASFILIYYGFVAGNKLFEDECKLMLKNDFNHAKNALEIPSNISIISPFEDIYDLLNRQGILISDIKNTDDVKNKQNAIGRNLSEMEHVNDLKNGTELLKLIEKKISILKSKRDNTVEKCETAADEYKKLMTDIKAIEKVGSKVVDKLRKASTDVNNIERSLMLKNQFENLKIPADIYARYLCSTQSIKSLKDLINIAMRIKKTLLQKKEKLLANLKYMGNLEAIKILKENVTKPVLIGGSINKIEKLKKQIIALRKYLEKIKQMKITRVDWYKLVEILEKKLQEDIQNADEIRTILDQRDEAKRAFEEIQETVANLCKMKVCQVEGSVNVEQ